MIRRLTNFVTWVFDRGIFADMANGWTYVNGVRLPCMCYGCGSDEPMACGVLCADCLWEDHLASAAHTGSPFGTVRDSHPATPGCCMASRNEADQRYRLWRRQEYDATR